MPIGPSEVERIVKDRSYPRTTRALAEKWGEIFDLDPGWIMSHAFVESTMRPLAHNIPGNAWGLLQLKPGTANDIVRWIKASDRSKEPSVTKTLKLWHGRGEDLLNPELNTMLGAYYLARLKREFGDDHAIVSAAYNQGPGAARLALRTGKITPAMHKYIAAIEDAKERGYA